MSHDVFVSYSSKDKTVADFIVASLEGAGIRCWYAPRDIRPGGDWAKEIVAAIKEASVFLLVFSANANRSQRVLDELNLAISREAVILPFRIENLDPVGAMQLHLSARHWLDAFDPSWQDYTDKLVKAISAVLEGSEDELTEILRPAKRQPPRKKKPRKIGGIVAVALVVIIGVAVVIFGPELWQSLQRGVVTEMPTMTAAVSEEPTETAQVIEIATPTTSGPAIGSADNPIIMMYLSPEEAEFADIDAASEEIENLFHQEFPDLTIKLLPTNNMDSIRDALCNGDAHVGLLDSFTYLEITQEDCNVEAKLVWSAYEDIKWGGEFLIRASDTSIQELADLEGKTLCIVEYNSTSSWVVPALEIKAALGDPETVLGDVIEVGSHTEVPLAVNRGDCDVGTAYYDV
ncbi:MAG: TIR domain-containing protein, partial [Anaerolineaceae bacterium]|nr:TIR domain-containing protein [Anaerolineaceae bacterium]